MSELFIVVSLLGIPALLVGMIRPRLYGGGRGRAAAIGLGMILGGFVGFGVTDDPTAREARRSQPAATAQPPAQAPAEAPAVPAPSPPPRPAARPAASPTAYVAHTPDGHTFVWRNSASHSEAMRLIRDGVHRTAPQLIMRHVSCVIQNGTPVTIVDAGLFSHTVVVTGGQHTGCRGDVAREDLAPR